MAVAGEAVRQFPSPVMRRVAGLDADQARRKLLEERTHLRAQQCLASNGRALRIYAVNLENVLGQIEDDR